MDQSVGAQIALPEGIPGTPAPDPRHAGPRHADPRYMVPALSRGLALLRLFDRRHPARTLVELAQGLGITRSAAYRLVYTLEKDGFLVRDAATRCYRLTSQVLEIGFEYLNSQGLTEIAAPELRRLSDLTSAAAHLVVLDGWHVVYLARSAPPPASAMVVSNLQVGSRLPCHLTASGRVLLAWLDERGLREVHRRLLAECLEHAGPPAFEAFAAQALADRARGYVFRPSIIDPGFRTFAAPVVGAGGQALAAVNVIGADRAMTELRGEAALRDAVLAATAAIARHLGHKPPIKAARRETP